MSSPIQLVPRVTSNNLSIVIDEFKAANPRTWAVVYVDPRDGLLTVSADGHSHHEQVGIIEKAKMIVMYHREEDNE